MSHCRAVIDVGTNSVKLLIAEVSGSIVFPIKEKSEQTRLGQGFYVTNHLLPANIALTAETVAHFARKARQHGAENIRVIATSAARDAINQQELIEKIKAESGLVVEVISGEMEADYAFRGVISDPFFANQRLLIVDLGGGSIEFILGTPDEREFCESFALGTVRLMEKLEPLEPPTLASRKQCEKAVRSILHTQVEPLLQPLLKNQANLPRLVGTGGTATILARIEKCMPEFDRDAIEGACITGESVRKHADRLWGAPIAERREIIGLPAKRADIILPGVIIYQELLELFGFSEFYVSTRGLRFAAVIS